MEISVTHQAPNTVDIRVVESLRITLLDLSVSNKASAWQKPVEHLKLLLSKNRFSSLSVKFIHAPGECWASPWHAITTLVYTDI